jgi:ATP-dependent Clp protease, protease subunit
MKTRIEIRGIIVGPEYDEAWAESWIKRGIITPESLVLRQIQEAKGDIELYVNSGGGSVFSGAEMLNALKLAREAGHGLTIIVGAMAASMAADIVISAGAPVRAFRNSRFMFHGASTVTWGGNGAHEDTAALLEKINATTKAVLTGRFGVPEATVSEWYAEGRMGWLSADEAKGFGIVAEIIDEDDGPLRVSKEEADAILGKGVDVAACHIEVEARAQGTETPPPPPPPEDDPFMVLSRAHERAVARVAELEQQHAAERATRAESERALAQQATAEAHRAQRAEARENTLKARLARLQADAFALPGEPKSWAEALATCGGDYEQASKRFPNLKAARMGKA